MRFPMKAHTIRSAFALRIHQNVCVFRRIHINVDTTMERPVFLVVLHVFRDSECDAGGGWVNGNFIVTQLLNSPLLVQ